MSQGREASRLSKSENESCELHGEFVLRQYYMCNGKNWHRKAFLNPGCPSGHLHAKELEELVWSEIEGFLNDPENIIAELSGLLRDRLGEGGRKSELFKELDELHAEAAVMERALFAVAPPAVTNHITSATTNVQHHFRQHKSHFNLFTHI